MPTADDYAWIHETPLGEGACVAVVPAADRAAVLAAYGARLDTASPLASDDERDDLFGRDVVQVVEVGDALVLIEDLGGQGSRPEVIGPLSRASGVGLAASFTWTVNHDTCLAHARAGAVELSLDVGYLAPGDPELDELPVDLHALALAGADEDDGDPIAAGIAMVAVLTGTAFRAEVVTRGTVYELDPTPEALRPHAGAPAGPDGADDDQQVGYRFDPLDELLPGGSRDVAALPTTTQRTLAEWATRATIREAGLDGPVVREVLAGLAGGGPAPVPDGLDALVRTTARQQADFDRLETDLGYGGREWPRDHPYYEVELPGDFGPVRAISHLEGSYLAQRSMAAEVLRRAGNPDALAAAVDCLDQLAGCVRAGRTTRGWLFEATPEGRRRVGSFPDPRYEQLVATVRTLLADLASGAVGPEVWRRAEATLPVPLTDAERVEAIHHDALADARGEFATYQISGSHIYPDPDPDAADDPDWSMAWDDAVLQTVMVEIGGEGAAGDDDHLDLVIDSLEEEVRRCETVLEVLADPTDALAVIRSARTWAAVVGAVATTFGLDEETARVLVATRLRPVSPADVREWRWERDASAGELLRRREERPHHHRHDH